MVVEGVVMMNPMQSLQLSPESPQTPTVPTDVTSKGGKLVYVYLSAVAETTVTDIADALGLKHIELLPVLRSLQQAGHVERAGEVCRIAR